MHSRPNRVIHFEIHASNPSRVAKFYQSIFGWEIKRWENPAQEYWIIMTAPQNSKEPGINGGIVARRGPAPKGGEPVNAFICTIGVPNVDEYLQKIELAGGRTALAKMAIPGLAWLAYASDIEGNIFGIYQEDKNAK